MDIDGENKKRKVDDEQAKEPKKLEDILTRHLDSQKEMVEVLVVIFQKLARLEQVFTNPLIKEE
jgi:hypothetical protein